MIGNSITATAYSLVLKRLDDAWERRLIANSPLRGKYVLITGAADPDGLNAQLLKLLVRMGIAGAVLLDIDPRVHDLRNEIPDGVLVCSADVSNEDDMELAAERIESFLGDNKLSLVVAGAGTFVPSAAVDIDISALERVFQVTTIGTAVTFKMAMRFASKEKCVFISAGSAAATACFPGMVTYNVAKASLESLVNTQKAEYAGTGWEFYNMVFAQVAGTQLTAWFDKLEFARALFQRSRGARMLNRHARPRPAVRHLAMMAMGGWRAEIFRFYPIHRVALLALFPAFARPVVHWIIGKVTAEERQLLAEDMRRLALERGDY